MATKIGVLVVIFCTLAVVSFNYCSGAPKPSNRDLLEKRIADYLRHDPELVKELTQLEQLSQNHARLRRQADFDDSSNGADGTVEEQKPGFFDKAAKFVVELLQRFLKWINTENS